MVCCGDGALMGGRQRESIALTTLAPLGGFTPSCYYRSTFVAIE
jgi:hypothetical protein